MSGVFVFDAGLWCVFANRESILQLGVRCARGMRPWEIKPFIAQRHLRRLFRAAKDSGVVQFHAWHAHASGFQFPVAVTVRYEEGLFVADTMLRGEGVLAELAAGIEAASAGVAPESSANLRYYAAVLRALSLGYGAASVLSPESALTILDASSLFSADSS